MQHTESTTPLADAALLVRHANACRRDGCVSDAVDSYCRAAAIYGASGMHGRARGALTIAWRLVVDAAGDHPARLASIASELSRIQYENGFANETQEVVRTSVDLLLRTGHVGLAMNLAEWAVETARQDPGLAGLSAYLVQRLGLGLARSAPMFDVGDTLVDGMATEDSTNQRDTLVDELASMAMGAA